METTMRKCSGKYMKCINGKWEPASFDLGYFHQWGVNFEEFESGPANYSVAIVELQDGSIITPVAQDIQFLDAVAE